MRVSTSCASVVVVLSLLALQACDDSAERSSVEPVGPELSARSAGCDFGRMSQDARSYFPGNGAHSVSADVQDLIDVMEDACAGDDDYNYTVAWFQVAGIIEQVLAKGTGGNPADGASFLNQSVSVLGPDETTPIFDPCDELRNDELNNDEQDDCEPWDGADDGFLPPFLEVLESSDNGAWAVVNQVGTESPASVCSDFTNPCESWMGGPETWGVEPTTTWGDALWDRPSLLFGYPIGSGSPTGETTFGGPDMSGDPDMSAYDWLLIPHPDEFGSDGELLVSFCSGDPAQVGQLMVQKGSTILKESEDSSWCTLDTGPVGETSLLQRISSFLSPLPAPLNATLLAKGPGGGGLAGSFTDFYGVDIPTEAVIAIPSQPADGYVGQKIVARDNGPFRVLAETSSRQSPLEKVHVTVEVIGNLGLIPADETVSAGGLTCGKNPEGSDAESGCDSFFLNGFTQSDEEDDPGTLLLPLEFTKTGQYSLCFTAKLTPLQFGEVCTEKFNIRP